MAKEKGLENSSTCGTAAAVTETGATSRPRVTVARIAFESAADFNADCPRSLTASGASPRAKERLGPSASANRLRSVMAATFARETLDSACVVFACLADLVGSCVGLGLVRT